MLPIRAPANVPDFTPVPRRARSDGWTEARQRAFIAMLAATGSVSVAADSVGLCISGAYKLRGEPGAASFVRAWSDALDAGVAALRTLAFDRAVNGVPVTLHYKGEQTATTTRHDNRLLMSLLRNYDRPGTAAATAAEYEGATDTATIMWLVGLGHLNKLQWVQGTFAHQLETLLKIQKFPDTLDSYVWTATYMTKQANADLDHQLRISNLGPAGMRKNAAGVTHQLKPVELTAAVRERADKVLAYLRGVGPPLTMNRRPIPEGGPEVHTNDHSQSI